MSTPGLSKGLEGQGNHDLITVGSACRFVLLSACLVARWRDIVPKPFKECLLGGAFADYRLQSHEFARRHNVETIGND